MRLRPWLAATRTTPARRTPPHEVNKMAKMSRRTFLTRTTATATTVGVLGAGIGFGADEVLFHSSNAQATQFDQPLMAYVTNAAKGEITFLMGSKEVVRTDPSLVARLKKAMG